MMGYEGIRYLYVWNDIKISYCEIASSLVFVPLLSNPD